MSDSYNHSDFRHILLVDHDHDYLDWAEKHLSAEGIKILKCDSPEKAVLICQKVHVEILVSDIDLQPFNGIELLKKVNAEHKGTLCILTSSFPNPNQIIQATQQGAHDILKKQSLTFELRAVIEGAWQLIDGRLAASTPQQEPAPNQEKIAVVGNSKVFQEVYKLVGRVASSDAHVLISGESGTGKELVAKSIHEYSPRNSKELVALNCGAIPEHLLESELFGHEKGAFTGAIARRIGRFEQCDGGTLFLDEIGDMPLSVQVKLLRVLQDGKFSRVGGNETLHSDVRIVTATNKNLAQEVAAGNFREDLYYRLNIVELHLPPLRDRDEDIGLLAEFFLERITRKHGMARIRLSAEAIEKLNHHRWPGNVRELENTIARACALATNDLLLPDDIPLPASPLHLKNQQQLLGQIISNTPTGSNSFDYISKALAGFALELSNGSPAAAAKLLSCSKDELHAWLAVKK